MTTQNTNNSLVTYVCNSCGAVKSASSAPKKCHECRRDAMIPQKAKEANMTKTDEVRKQNAWNRIRFQGGLLIPIEFVPEEYRAEVMEFIRDNEKSAKAKAWSQKVWEDVVRLKKSHPKFWNAVRELLNNMQHFQARDDNFMFEGLRADMKWYTDKDSPWNAEATRRLLSYMSNKLKKAGYRDVNLSAQGFLVWSWRGKTDDNQNESGVF